MNKKTKRIGAALLIAVIGVSAFYYISATGSTAKATVETVVLKKTTITNSISASGIVESGKTRNVYTNQNYPIKEINVEVGDEVKKGDVLAVLDMETVVLDIEQAQLNLEKTKKSATQEQKTVSEGIQNAQNSVTISKIALDKQEMTYDTLKTQYENGTNQELVNAKTAVQTAEQTIAKYQRDADKKEKDLELNQALYDAGAITEYDLSTYETAYDDVLFDLAEAKTEYQRALDSLSRTKTKLKQDLSQSKKDLENAKASYNSSTTSLNQSKSKTSSSAEDIESQKISLQKLNDQMNEVAICAPIDGTITQVNAVIGALPSGVLFEIQDMNELYINADVKEYDIHSIAIGQKAVLKTEGTKDNPINGTVTFISPIAKETQSGNTTNVKYETHIDVLDKDHELKIGMNARADIELETKKGIYSVNYGSIVSQAGGEQSIYIVEDGIVKEIPITSGLETDTSVEIISEALKDGTEVIVSPSGITPGTTVSIGKEAAK